MSNTTTPAQIIWLVSHTIDSLIVKERIRLRPSLYRTIRSREIPFSAIRHLEPLDKEGFSTANLINGEKILIDKKDYRTIMEYYNLR